MAEPATIEFVDQTQRRRKLQLHDVDGQLRVNLTSALANYEAASFTRLADGLVLEGYKGSDYSAVAFKAGEEVLVEAVFRNAGGSSPLSFEHVSSLAVLEQQNHQQQEEQQVLACASVVFQGVPRHCRVENKGTGTTTDCAMCSPTLQAWHRTPSSSCWKRSISAA